MTCLEQQEASAPLQEQVSADKVAGRLYDFIHFWESITSDQYILDSVRGLRIPFSNLPTQNVVPKEINCSKVEMCAINREIEKYVKEGIIEEVAYQHDQYISQIFPRMKKSGKTRIILNLSKLNLDVKYQHFKMESLSSVLRLMEKGCFMSSIDLKDAYYSVPIDKSDRKF